MPIGEYLYHHTGAIFGAVIGGLTGGVYGESTGLTIEDQIEQAMAKHRTNTELKQ